MSDEQKPPDLATQEDEGQFLEEIQKIVDGVIEDVRGGHVRSRSAARVNAAHAANHSAYAVDPDLAPATFKWGAQPETRERVAEMARRVVWACVLNLLADDETYRGLPT